MKYARKTYKAKKRTIGRKPRYSNSKALTKTVKKIIRQVAPKETKVKDTEYSLFNGTSYTETTVTLSDTSQGDTFDTRDGETMYLKSVQLALRVYFGESPQLFSVFGKNPNLYYWIVKGSHTQGTTPTLTDLLEDTTDYENSFRKVAASSNGMKFTVLKSGMLRYSGTDDQEDKVKKLFISFPKPLRIKFNASNAPQDNGVYMILKAPSANDGTTGGVTTIPIKSCKLKFRIKFLD